MVVDKTLSENSEMQLLEEADELFGIIFKVTFYDAPKYAVSNCETSELKLEN